MAQEAQAPTTAFTVVEQTTPGTTLYDTPAAGVATGEVMVHDQYGVPDDGFRITPLLAVAALAGVLGVASGFVGVLPVAVTDTATGSRIGSVAYKLNDLGTSHLVGAIIGLVLLVAGGAMGAMGRRVGSGLAGGTGLALAGMLANACGIAIATADAALFTVLPGQTVTSTFELGFFLAIGAASLGGVAFILSLREMGADGQPAVPPAIGVLGALGALAVVVGTLLPGDLAEFGDNFGVEFLPPATTWLRLLVLVLIAVGGFVGFLANRRWGLGMALGSISVGTWMWGTALTEAGDIPIGIAGGNIGALDVQPHLITTIGVVVMVVAGVVGLIAAAQQRG